MKVIYVEHTACSAPHNGIKYLLQIWMPILSRVQNEVVLVRVKGIHPVRFQSVDVWECYRTFVGRGFKTWAQLNVCVLFKLVSIL